MFVVILKVRRMTTENDEVVLDERSERVISLRADLASAIVDAKKASDSIWLSTCLLEYETTMECELGGRLNNTWCSPGENPTEFGGYIDDGVNHFNWTTIVEEGDFWEAEES